jgi:hypothetical protein
MEGHEAVPAHQVVRARLPEGPVIQVEARTDVALDREEDVAIADVLAFDGVSDAIASIARSLTAAIERAKPDKASVVLGLDIGVEAGALTALIAKGKGTAALTVTFEWDASA